MKINVTKSFLPPISEYYSYIEQIWNSGYLTNQGPLLKELENKINNFLKIKNSHFVTNGTVALQIALKALGIENGDIITTPFSYVATLSSILWERCNPIFVDIEPNNFTIDVTKIEEKITPNTKAIMAVHVFGYACDVNEIDRIAQKHGLKVIYDGAHAFGSIYKGKSLLDYGDISTCSFHATKLFHTIEGGLCVVKDNNISDKLDLIKRFGHNFENHECLGINAKASEFQAAMGLCNIKYIERIIEERKEISEIYDKLLKNIKKPMKQESLTYNYSYYPVIFKNENQLLKIIKELANQNIFIRRYFYPSLNDMPYIKNSNTCSISKEISSKIACLPIYSGLKKDSIIKISHLLNDCLK